VYEELKTACHVQAGQRAVVKNYRQELLSSNGTQVSKDSRKLRSVKRSDDGRMSELRDKFPQPVTSLLSRLMNN
jgi:hypothetical protein